MTNIDKHVELCLGIVMNIFAVHCLLESGPPDLLFIGQNNLVVMANQRKFADLTTHTALLFHLDAEIGGSRKVSELGTSGSFCVRPGSVRWRYSYRYSSVQIELALTLENFLLGEF